MSLIKELIKAPRVNKLYAKYMYQLEMSYVSYDDFVKEQEKYDFSQLKPTDKVSVFCYSDLECGFDFSKISTEYIMFCSDIKGLNSYAKEAVADAFEGNHNFKVVYADEDELNNSENVRMNPWYKPDYSPDTLIDYMYFGNMVAFRTEELNGVDNVKDIYDLCLKVCLPLRRNQVGHINNALYHAHYLKQLCVGKKYNDLKQNYTNTEFSKDFVSIVIPSKDNPDILGICLNSVIKLTRDISYEIIVVDNGSSDANKQKIEELIERLNQDFAASGYVETTVNNPCIKYVYDPQPFNFSRMCNKGAKRAQGGFVLFLNDDIEVREGKWLAKMLTVAKRPHAGAVGAKLYYPNSMMIQHTGITNLRLGPVHKLQFKDDNANYYFGINNGVRNCLAVTGACLLVDKTKFDEVGGFAEELEVAFNDVDLCFRLYEFGYNNVVCNNTHLWHHESLSRGNDESKEKLERLTQERRLLYERHPNLYGVDPYYSKFLTNDILDTNYSKIYEYDYAFNSEFAIAKVYNKEIRDYWYNECLMVSMEYVGSVADFEGASKRVFDLKELGVNADKKKLALISGYAYVAGSDNSQFKNSIILKGKNKSYIINALEVFRPDLEINLDPNENALMCGFSVAFDLQNIDADIYQVAVLCESGSSRLKLYKETNKYIRVEE